MTKNGNRWRLCAGVLAGVGMLVVLRVPTAPSGLPESQEASTSPSPTAGAIGMVYGYVDLNGRIAIKPRFADADDFHEGLARVYVQGKGYGFIDSAGRFVIPPGYDRAGRFSGGLASARVDGKYGYIDRAGQWIIKPVYAGCGRFSSGLAPVNIGGKEAGFAGLRRVRGGLWGYVAADGRLAIPAKYSQAREFSEGMAAVLVAGRAAGTRGGCGFINRSGKIVIPPAYRMVGDFSGGLARVWVLRETDDRSVCGYINSRGETVVEHRFEAAEDFHDGLAAAKLKTDGRWGFIGIDGKYVIPPQFADSVSGRRYRFSEGLALVEWDGRRPWDRTSFGIINLRGTVLAKGIDGQDLSGRFSHGLARSTKHQDGSYSSGFVRPTGNWAFTLKPGDTASGEFHEGLARIARLVRQPR